MRNPRHHAILEIYQLVLAAFLFVSPWLFAFAHGTLRIDTWVSAALVAVISLCRAHCIPGLERVDRLHPRSLDCGFTVGVGLPAHGGDVHKPGHRPLDCVPGAARPLADPLWFVFGKSIKQPASARLGNTGKAMVSRKVPRRPLADLHVRDSGHDIYIGRAVDRRSGEPRDRSRVATNHHK